MANMIEARPVKMARASGTSTHAAATSRNIQRKCARVIVEGADGQHSLIVAGRELWTLEHLVRAGARGVTPIERPAPRWSHYVHQLREMGLAIETIREEHGGDFPGFHGRYVLRSRVVIKGGADV